MSLYQDIGLFLISERSLKFTTLGRFQENFVVKCNEMGRSTKGQVTVGIPFAC
jgi:hypothetical protein